MTTKPKAKRFRIRRSSPLADLLREDDGEAETEAPGAGAAPDEDEDGFGADVFPTARSGDIMSAAEVSADAEIDAIRREGLTGRQLRMARRVAQKHGLPATSDFDAVRLLRRAGIDPFQRANVLELVVGDGDGPATAEGGGGQTPPPGTAQLPATRDPSPKLPQRVRPAPVPAAPLPQNDGKAEEARLRDIMRIQRDIARRRRRRLALLAARLAFFVMLPTFLAGYYFYEVATPLYGTRSEFVIQKAEAMGGAGQLGGLFAGTQFANSQDSISVQSYLQSRDAMMRLDKEYGFRAAFSTPDIDPIQRLDPNASNEEAYRVYQRNVKIGYDPTEGIIKMEVIAPTAELSEKFSRALISYAEEQVDHMTQRLREDQMTGARQSYEDAEQKMLDAQQRVVDLQEQFKVLSSEVEVNLITQQISNLDTQLTRDKLTLQEIMSNPSPSPARVDPLKRRIESVENQIAELRSRLTEDGENGPALAKVRRDLQIAEADVQTRQMLLAQALQALETARIEANRQVRYLSLGVTPVAPDQPTYPRAFENTLVAFLIFAGIYLMLSMTASILREQVSA